MLKIATKTTTTTTTTPTENQQKKMTQLMINIIVRLPQGIEISHIQRNMSKIPSIVLSFP